VSQKRLHYPPDPFVDDFDVNGAIDAGVLDSRILPCIGAASKALKDDFRDIAKDTCGRRFVVASHLESMRDVHVVIRKIYALFPGREQLAAFPLGRQQIEHLLILIGLLRNGDDFFCRYKKASIASAYKYFFYLSQETKNLKGFAESYTHQESDFGG
jgi:hypothetical protein